MVKNISDAPGLNGEVVKVLYYELSGPGFDSRHGNFLFLPKCLLCKQILKFVTFFVFYFYLYEINRIQKIESGPKLRTFF